MSVINTSTKASVAIKKGRRRRHMKGRAARDKHRRERTQSFWIKRRYSNYDPSAREDINGLPCRVGNRDFRSAAKAARFYGSTSATRLLANLHRGAATWRGLPIEWLPEALIKLNRNSKRIGLPVRVDNIDFPTCSAAEDFFGWTRGRVSRNLRHGNYTVAGLSLKPLGVDACLPPRQAAAAYRSESE